MKLEQKAIFGYIESDIHRRLKVAAAQNSTTMSQLVEKALVDLLAQLEDSRKEETQML